MSRSSVPEQPSNGPFRGSTATKLPPLVTADEELPGELAVAVFRNMARTRALEERSIKLSKSGEAHFWIGGPGEETFNVCLGMQIHRGFGPAYDYLHLHYRNAGVMLGMGMAMEDHLRQLVLRATDTHSRGRNFVGHYAMRDWNVIPVTSVISVQYAMAPGTALMQKRHGGEGVSVVVGGDAGTAEGDFACCMIWSTRPGDEVPVLMCVTNNGFGISTPAESQHGETSIATRGDAFNIPNEQFNGNDPVTTWNAVRRGLDYCRDRRKPYLLEAMVSRLHGHSSSSGAQRTYDQPDPVRDTEQRLLETDILHRDEIDAIWHDAREEVEDAVTRVLKEPEPRLSDVERFTYASSSVDQIYPDDYTGLPQ